MTDKQRKKTKPGFKQPKPRALPSTEQIKDRAARTIEQVESHIDYLESTLIYDLIDSGKDATAEDFVTCCRLMKELIACLKETV